MEKNHRQWSKKIWFYVVVHYHDRKDEYKDEDIMIENGEM